MTPTPRNYTQSLGGWHGFIAQQKMISIKKHFGTTDRRYIYLSGWMVAALRSRVRPAAGPVDAREDLRAGADRGNLHLPAPGRRARTRRPVPRHRRRAQGRRHAREAASCCEPSTIIQTHVVPIIADIDAGFGNAEATYLLAKKMIEAGACALQIENQVSDEKQCGHQDGKVTVPHEDFLAKIRACRYAFLELGVEDGIIVTRTDSLGAGLTKQIAVSHAPGDLGDQYNSLPRLRGSRRPTTPATATSSSTATASCCGRSGCPATCIQFRAGTGADRCVLDCITSLQNGADLLWIETEKPHVEQIAEHGRPHPRSRPQRQAGLQQLAVLQLDAEFPPAGVRCVEEGRQGRVGL